MPELIQLKEDIYYIHDNNMNYGIVRVDSNKTVAIDTGLNDDSAEVILAAVGIEGMELAAIINTHSHADHYGGNNYLVDKTGCVVYAPPLEAAIMTNPSLESFYLYGAYPPEELRQPFIMAKASPIDVLLEEPTIEFGEKTFEIISLKGHSPNQIGVLVDGVFFCSDSVFSAKAWERLVLIYAINIDETVKSIERLKQTAADIYVPSHVAPTGDIAELADLNLTRIQTLVDNILHILRTPNDTATVLWELCERYNLKIHTLQQHYLCIDTLKAYLSYLLAQGLISYEFDANRLMWRSNP